MKVYENHPDPDNNGVTYRNKGGEPFDVQDMRKATHGMIPHTTAVVARDVESKTMFSVKSVTIESHDDTGLFTFWVNLEEY